MNFPTPKLPARVVSGPYGRLTHLDYRGSENRPGPTLGTACGRQVPDTWKVAHYTLQTALTLVTCPTCAGWAAYHARQVAADTQTAERSEQVTVESAHEEPTPSATCPGQRDAGRRSALRQTAHAADERMRAALRSLPVAGTPALC